MSFYLQHSTSSHCWNTRYTYNDLALIFIVSILTYRYPIALQLVMNRTFPSFEWSVHALIFYPLYPDVVFMQPFQLLDRSHLRRHMASHGLPLAHKQLFNRRRILDMQ